MVVLDTNVLSELLKADPDPAVLAWFAKQLPEDLHVTVVTQAEMMLGARILPPGRRRASLERAVSEMFESEFAHRVLPFDSADVPAYVDIVTARRKAGRPISTFDAQIAAIVRAQGAALATRNTADFVGCGFEILNPWLPVTG